MKSPKNRAMRSAKSSYLVLSGLFGSLAIYGVVDFIRTGIWDSLELAGIVLIPALLWIIFVASFKIILESDRLTYSSLFQQIRTIDFRDILKVSDKYVVDTQLNGLKRLNIWRKADPHKPYIAINLKMFKREDVQLLLATLKPYKHDS